MEIKSTKI